MKFEKRSGGGEQTPSSPQEEKSSGKKPVVIYIMILFIVAFLLMALSFVMHQRSNSEVLGELQDSVSAMQEIQSTQDALLDLQDQLDDAEEAIQDLETQAKENTVRIEGLVEEQDALLALYTLMQEYAAQNYENCQAIIEQMEQAGQPEILEVFSFGHGGVTRPADRYQQLKDAVEARTAADGAA